MPFLRFVCFLFCLVVWRVVFVLLVFCFCFAVFWFCVFCYGIVTALQDCVAGPYASYDWVH